MNNAKIRLTSGESVKVGARVEGFIYEDSQGRAPDGTPVLTSRVTSVRGNTFVTKGGTNYTVVL